MQGKDWGYIGERVLGRTMQGIIGHWDYLRRESLKPVEMRNKRRFRRKDRSLVSAMAKIPRMNKRWSKEEDEEMISLRAKGKSLKSISKRMGGRAYRACKSHWSKIKDQSPQAITASQYPEVNRKRFPMEIQNAHSSTASQLDQQAEDIDFDSRSVTVGYDDPKSSTNCGLPIEAGIDTSSAKQPDRETVVVQGGFVSADASKSPKSKASSTSHHNQHAANPSPVTMESGELNQPDVQSVVARSESKTQKESSFQKDLMRRGFLSLLEEREAREPRTHRRSGSCPR